MTWTKQGPKEPGWYWFRRPDDVTRHSYSVVQLYEIDGMGVFVRDEYNTPAAELPRILTGEYWSRAIRPPLEEGLGRTGKHKARDAIAVALQLLTEMQESGKAVDEMSGAALTRMKVHADEGVVRRLEALIVQLEDARNQL